MSGRFFPAKVVRARWSRPCMWCKHVIAKGEQYERRTWVDSGLAGTHISCLPCAALPDQRGT